IPSFLIQATLIGILGQRLVKKICPHCKEPFEIDASELVSLDLDIGKSGTITLQRGKGCIQCRGTGYHGRIGIFEVLPITESIRKKIIPEADTEALREIAIKEEGMITLRENAIKKLLEGTTTYQEVLRVTWEQI
ncbi:MAG: type II/IV secretion system protein, partial [Deltaproteobacteria bacterium]|nr:type II/IV secretion system protein [Deltaproteobacteria bacterium]